MIGIALGCLSLIVILHYYGADNENTSEEQMVKSESIKEPFLQVVSGQISSLGKNLVKSLSRLASKRGEEVSSAPTLPDVYEKAKRMAEKIAGKDPFEAFKILEQSMPVPVIKNQGPRFARMVTDGRTANFQSINGRLPRLLIAEGQKIEVSIDWPELLPARGGHGGAFVGAIDGGKVNGKFHQQWIELDQSGKLSFTFECGLTPGLYQVTLATPEGRQGSIEFWVPLEVEGQNSYDAEFRVRKASFMTKESSPMRNLVKKSAKNKIISISNRRFEVQRKTKTSRTSQSQDISSLALSNK